jgi:hypothetical protein
MRTQNGYKAQTPHWVNWASINSLSWDTWDRMLTSYKKEPKRVPVEIGSGWQRGFVFRASQSAITGILTPVRPTRSSQVTFLGGLNGSQTRKSELG